MRPAEGERDPAVGRLGGDRLVGGVAVALDDASIVVEQLQAMDRPAAGRIGEGDGWRVRAAPWPIVAGDRPEIALLDPTGGNRIGAPAPFVSSTAILAEVRMSWRRRS